MENLKRDFLLITFISLNLGKQCDVIWNNKLPKRQIKMFVSCTQKNDTNINQAITITIRGALSRAQVSLPGSVDHKGGSALYG